MKKTSFILRTVLMTALLTGWLLPSAPSYGSEPGSTLLREDPPTVPYDSLTTLAKRSYDLLKTEGFVPWIIDKGNIGFKYQGLNISLFAPAEDPNYLGLAAWFDSKEYGLTKEQLHDIFDDIMGNLKAIKAYLDTEGDICFATECLLDNDPRIEDILSRCCEILLHGVQQYNNASEALKNAK